MDDPTKFCPMCSLPYGFIRVRYTLYDKERKLYDICGPCEIERQKLSPYKQVASGESVVE